MLKLLGFLNPSVQMTTRYCRECVVVRPWSSSRKTHLRAFNQKIQKHMITKHKGDFRTIQIVGLTDRIWFKIGRFLDTCSPLSGFYWDVPMRWSEWCSTSEIIRDVGRAHWEVATLNSSGHVDMSHELQCERERGKEDEWWSKNTKQGAGCCEGAVDTQMRKWCHA